MLERHRPNREISAQTVYPHLTRPGLSIKGWQTPIAWSGRSTARAECKDWVPNYESSEQGIWLPPSEAAIAEFEMLQSEFGNASSHMDLLLGENRFDELNETLAGTYISAEGCWQASSSPTERILGELALLGFRNEPFEDSQEINDAKLCDSDGCLYPRHYDLSFGRPNSKKVLLAPDPSFYQTLNDKITTVWGDELPTVEASRQMLYDFKQKCLPYTDRLNSLLTIGGISQLYLLADTGCWYNEDYYTRTLIGSDGTAHQQDDYGRLRLTVDMAEKFGISKARYGLAHRVVWMLHGRKLKIGARDELNHLCGFKPCCNPEHMELVSGAKNMLHSQQMHTAINSLRDKSTAIN